MTKVTEVQPSAVSVLGVQETASALVACPKINQSLTSLSTSSVRQRRRQPASPPASVAAAWRGVGVGVGTGAGVGRPMELGVRPPTRGTRDARRTAPPKYRAPPPKHRTRHPARATHACTAALGYDASQCWEVQRGAPRGGGARSGGSVRSWLCQAAAASPLSAPYQCSTGCALVGAATPGTRIIPVGLGMFRAGDLWLSKSTATARRTYLARRRARAGAVVWRGARRLRAAPGSAGSSHGL